MQEMVWNEAKVRGIVSEACWGYFGDQGGTTQHQLLLKHGQDRTKTERRSEASAREMGFVQA
jgi:hypothetical protein